MDALEDFNPLCAFRVTEPQTGRDLFREANRESIVAQATKDQEAEGEPPVTQISYFQRAAKRAWEELSDEEKEKWNGQAAPEEPVVVESYTAKHVVK